MGQGKGKVVLQTFDKNSPQMLHKEMPQVPKILLLWIAEGSIEPKSKVVRRVRRQGQGHLYARQQPKDNAAFEQWVNDAKALRDRHGPPRP